MNKLDRTRLDNVPTAATGCGPNSGGAFSQISGDLFMQRRQFITAAGMSTVVAAAMAGSHSAAAGDPSLMNNAPDPLLTGKELPTFKTATFASACSARLVAIGPRRSRRGMSAIYRRAAVIRFVKRYLSEVAVPPRIAW